MKGIKGHISPETAHITFNYPFGSARCIRREWIETATKGAKKHEQRIMEQTAAKPWIYEYTRRIEADGLDTANQWALDELAACRVPFNKPHGSTYYNVIVMYIAPLPDFSNIEGVQYARLYFSSSPQQFADFRKQWADNLNPDQDRLIYLCEKVSRHYHRQTWAEWEAVIEQANTEGGAA